MPTICRSRAGGTSSRRGEVVVVAVRVRVAAVRVLRVARASRAESLGKGGEVVAHIAKVEQAAVCTCLRGRIVMLIDNGIGLPPPFSTRILWLFFYPSSTCCKRIPGRSPSFPSLITFWSQGNLFPSGFFLSAFPSSHGNLFFSPLWLSRFPEPARKLLPTFSGESRRPSPFWKFDLPGDISRGPRSSEEYGCWTGEW